MMLPAPVHDLGRFTTTPTDPIGQCLALAAVEAAGHPRQEGAADDTTGSAEYHLSNLWTTSMFSWTTCCTETLSHKRYGTYGI